MEGACKATVVLRESELQEASILRVADCQDAVVYLLAPVSHVVLVGCTDCIVVVGAAAASLKVGAPPVHVKEPFQTPVEMGKRVGKPLLICLRTLLKPHFQVELCERVHLVAAAARLRVRHEPRTEPPGA